MKLYSIQTLEKDMQKIVGKKNWKETEKLTPNFSITRSNGDIQYIHMPQKMQDKIKKYIYTHPMSRLAHAYINGIDGIRFRNYGYDDKGDIIRKPRKKVENR